MPEATCTESLSATDCGGGDRTGTGVAAPPVITVTGTGLVLPDGLTFKAWLHFGERLKSTERGIQWWLGDWLNYGKARYGEKYAQAVDKSQAHSWRQYAWVATRFEMSRRLDNVSWSAHQALAGIKDEGERYALLRYVGEGKWTVSEVRGIVAEHAVREAKKPGLLVASGSSISLAEAARVASLDRKANQRLPTWCGEDGWAQFTEEIRRRLSAIESELSRFARDAPGTMAGSRYSLASKHIYRAIEASTVLLSLDGTVPAEPEPIAEPAGQQMILNVAA